MINKGFFSKLKSKTKLIIFVSFTLTLLIGILIGYILKGILADYEKPAPQHFEIRESGFKFINPLLECDTARNAIENNELNPFKNKIESFIKNAFDKKRADSISVYFRKLNDGPWFSIGPTENFSPASLLKVPLMIAILKEAETNPKILTKKMKFEGIKDLTTVQRIRPSKTLESRKSYTVEELLYRMIVYSDNNAFYLLEDAVNSDIYKKTYDDMGIVNPYVVDEDDFISAETYASFFRVLFNASYLNKEMSEKAMEYLANAEFKDGLVAGVPSNIVVAHKFGEHKHMLGNNNEIYQLHDCGIIYYPNHPYLLCVMTKGNSFEYLVADIKEISRVVYEEIDRQYRNTNP